MEEVGYNLAVLYLYSYVTIVFSFRTRKEVSAWAWKEALTPAGYF